MEWSGRRRSVRPIRVNVSHIDGMRHSHMMKACVCQGDVMNFPCFLAAKISGDRPRRTQRHSAWCAFVVLLSALTLPVSAQQPQPFAAPGKSVILIGANQANDALSMPLRAGPLALDLYLQVDKPLPRARMQVTNFLAQSPSADVVSPRLNLFDGEDSQIITAQSEVSLASPGLHRLRIEGEDLHAGATYKGWLFLTAEGQNLRWELTLAVGGQGIIAVDPVGTLKFSRWPWASSTGEFSVTLRDKPEGGPYHNLRVRFEPNGAAASKAIVSNFSLDTFTFWEKQPDGAQRRVDLEQRAANANSIGKTAVSVQSVDLPRHGQRALQVTIAPLSPGEYTGGLRFAAAESADDATDSKLPLTIQVRHAWQMPVLVILFGSLIGWYSSKYVVAVRKSGELARQVRGLRARLDYLARPNPSSSGWSFPGEATSYGLARVRVLLSQLAQLSTRALPMLVREDQITQQQRDAEQRLIGLESLQATRLRVQPLGNSRPAVQRALGQLLRRATDRLSRPTFDPTQQSELTKLLQIGDSWLAQDPADALTEKYREALLDRLQSDEIPDASDLSDVPVQIVRSALATLHKNCPSDDAIKAEASLETLKDYDQRIAKLALLWRECKFSSLSENHDCPWLEPLAKSCTGEQSLEELFRIVDEGLWAKLLRAADPERYSEKSSGNTVENTASRLQIVRDANADADLQAYDLVEVRLTSGNSDFDARIVNHPLRVVWRIVPPNGNVRTDEADGLTLLQYFSSPGAVRLQAFLRWQGREIAVKHELALKVVANPDYDKSQLVRSGIATEWAVLAIAAGFAVATAMASLYDSTFGSFSQYLALFVWAAGAGTGGNLFKQLGTASAAGGQADSGSPSTPGGAIR
jgi:hypothetical protein